MPHATQVPHGEDEWGHEYGRGGWTALQAPGGAAPPMAVPVKQEAEEVVAASFSPQFHSAGYGEEIPGYFPPLPLCVGNPQQAYYATYTPAYAPPYAAAYEAPGYIPFPPNAAQLPQQPSSHEMPMVRQQKRRKKVRARPPKPPVPSGRLVVHESTLQHFARWIISQPVTDAGANATSGAGTVAKQEEPAFRGESFLVGAHFAGEETTADGSTSQSGPVSDDLDAFPKRSAFRSTAPPFGGQPHELSLMSD